MHVRDLIGFLGELAENNNRAWFVMNKPRYDILRAEFLELVTRVIRAVSDFDPAVSGCAAQKALFRINKDLRFARDRRPYKTHFSAAITATGLKKPSQGGGPAYYFHINECGQLLYAGGEYRPPADRLRQIREHIVADPGGLTSALNNQALRERYGELQNEGKLIRLPRGFEEHLPVADLLRHKSFIVWRENDLNHRRPEDLAEDLAAAFRDSYPLVSWLRGA